VHLPLGRLRAQGRILEIAAADLAMGPAEEASLIEGAGLALPVDRQQKLPDPFFASAFEDAADADASPLAALLLAERCLVAIARHDWPRAEAFTNRALSVVEDGQLQDYWTSALVYACAARTALHRGEVHRARLCAAQAARLRPLLTSTLPVVSVQALLELARAYIALADPGGAGAVLRQVQDILRDRPDLGALPGQAGQLSSMLERMTGDSVYRKLDVSSRRQAVTRTRELGLTVG
jgi:LuxR family maltose regulon positive regulatory protein